MRPTRYIPVAVLSVAALGAGVVFTQAQTATDTPVAEAGAERGGDRARLWRANHRGGGMGFGRGFSRDLFDMVDADGDGTVTAEEIAAYRTAKLAEIDVSGDGAVSIDEFDTLYRELTRSRMVDAFQALDADGDGLISTEEADRRIDRLVERMDRDRDGALTLQRRGDRDRDE